MSKANILKMHFISKVRLGEVGGGTASINQYIKASPAVPTVYK